MRTGEVRMWRCRVRLKSAGEPTVLLGQLELPHRQANGGAVRKRCCRARIEADACNSTDISLSYLSRASQRRGKKPNDE